MIFIKPDAVLIPMNMLAFPLFVKVKSPVDFFFLSILLVFVYPFPYRHYLER